jgi:hypothetical protein
LPSGPAIAGRSCNRRQHQLFTLRGFDKWGH